VRGGAARTGRTVARLVTVMTGHRQIEGCLSLFGYR